MTKTYSDLYPTIASFENLHRAFRKAARGKRGQRSVAAFEFDLESNLCRLEEELAEQTYRPGPYRLLSDLRLTLHERESTVYPVACGIPFLGFRVYPDHRRLKRRNGLAFARRLRASYRAVARGDMPYEDLRRRVQGWIAHAGHGNTWRLRRSLLATPVPKRCS